MVEDLLNDMIQWWYQKIVGAAVEWIPNIGNMGAELFDFAWVKAFVQLFSRIGWMLFLVGAVLAIYDFALAYRKNSGTKMQDVAMNITKAAFAALLFGSLPVALYRFSVSLQLTLLPELIGIFVSDAQQNQLGTLIFTIFQGVTGTFTNPVLSVVITIAYLCCIIKIFFANIKRGGLLLVQITVGSLYMISIPRGYWDGFWQWAKQIAALCLTAFLQTIMLVMGLVIFSSNMMVGLGIMLAACEVPRIAQQFGLDTSVKANISSTVYAAQGAVSLIRTLKPA